MVLHELDERVDRLQTEVVLAAPGEGVRLVDQQRAAECRFEDGAGAGGGLTDVAGDELGSIGLDEVALGDDVEGAEDLAEEPGDGGLAGARVAGEHEVVAGLDGREVAFDADPLDPQQAGQAADLLLHVVEPDQLVELGEQFLQRTLRWELWFGGSVPAGDPAVATVDDVRLG